jgi:hypothetical protein
LLSTIDARDAAFHVHRLSLCHRLDYLAQIVSPFLPGVLEAFAGVDRVLRRAEVRLFGVDPYDQAAASCSDPGLSCLRAELPARFKGIGLPRVADICYAAYVGAVEMTVPRFGDATLEDGTVVPGLANHLTPFVGDAKGFSSSADRYLTFIESGLASGEAFRDCWDHMRDEVGDAARVGSIFEADAKDAPGLAPPEDVDPRAAPGKVRLQRLCTRGRQTVRKRSVQLRMALLGPADALRRAWDVDIPSAFFVSLPTPHTRASGLEVCSMVSIYMGIEDPLLLHHKGLVFRDRNTRGGPLFRELDAHGHALSLYFGAGHGRFALHNELEALSHRFALLVGYQAVRQPADVFSSAIRNESRDKFNGDQRKAAKSHRGGIIFDLFIRGFHLPSGEVGFVDRGYDWKTIGMLGPYYDWAIGRATDKRAAEVPVEYEANARRVDAAYNGVPVVRGGPPGPVLAMLRAMPPVTGLVVGAFGEFSRDVGQFVSDIAEKASLNPERFGCCHGPDQARGVVAGFVNRAFGRASLRGVARARHAALAAVTGSGRFAHGPGRADVLGAENAWDTSGDRACGGFPP